MVTVKGYLFITNSCNSLMDERILDSYTWHSNTTGPSEERLKEVAVGVAKRKLKPGEQLTVLKVVGHVNEEPPPPPEKVYTYKPL